MIEVLCLGLNFIPNDSNSTLDQPLKRLTRDLNTRIIFSKKPLNDLRSKSWLTSFIKSDWDPEQQTWLLDTAVVNSIEKLPSIGNPLWGIKKDPFLTPELMKTITSLKRIKTAHILKSDKGRNTVLWSIADYDREANRQLDDESTYMELSVDEYNLKLSSIKNRCRTISENLLALNLISITDDETICRSPPKGSSIYFLPKIHKNEEKTSKTFPGRPIVATFTSVTYLLDKYITTITGHILPLIPGSVKDTNHFIRSLPTSELPTSTQLITADVNSLYPNIPWNEGIFAATQFYKKHFQFLTELATTKKKYPPPPPRLFNEILSLVLCNSMIQFKNRRYFHQIKGTAMGCCISVYFANCYMYYITRQVIHNPPAWLVCFTRFIDDLFFIVSPYNHAQFKRTIALISNKNIQYEISDPAVAQNFLDTTVSLTRNNVLSIAPFSKDTASGSYLHPFSAHPGHTIRATPYSQFLRIRRISSNRHNFLKFGKKMIRDFKNMGYPKSLISKQFQRVLKKHRDELFMPNIRSSFGNSFKLITNFNKERNWKALREGLDQLYALIINHYAQPGPFQDVKVASYLNNSSIVTVFSNSKNLSSYFSGNLKK